MCGAATSFHALCGHMPAQNVSSFTCIVSPSLALKHPLLLLLRPLLEGKEQDNPITKLDEHAYSQQHARTIMHTCKHASMHTDTYTRASTNICVTYPETPYPAQTRSHKCTLNCTGTLTGGQQRELTCQ